MSYPERERSARGCARPRAGRGPVLRRRCCKQPAPPVAHRRRNSGNRPALGGAARCGCGATASARSSPARRSRWCARLRERTLGMRHFDVQLIGGWALLQGMVAEMETGEGKTLTATLAAATAALAGPRGARHHGQRLPREPRRRADAPGLRGARPDRRLRDAGHGAAGAARGLRAATSPTAPTRSSAFDYLRDRLALGGKPRPLGAAHRRARRRRRAPSACCCAACTSPSSTRPTAC